MRRTAALCVALLFVFAPLALSEDWSFSLNNKKVSAAEAAIYVFNAEARYEVVAEYYECYLGVDFWGLEYDNGLTVSETIKADVFKSLVMMNTYYNMAVERSITLNDNETEFCISEANDYWHIVSGNENIEFSYDDVLALYKKQMLADMVYESEAALLEIDENAVIASVDKSACVSYEIEYLCVNRETAFGVSSNDVFAALAGVNQDSVFTEIADKNADFGIMYNRATITVSESVDSIILSAVSAMSIGEISGVLETDYGLFILRLLDDTDTCAYEQAVEKALYLARSEAYKKVYDEMYNLAEYEINITYWDSLSLGKH